MKFAPFLLSAAVFLCAPAMAQTPAAGGDHSVTATCKDGTTYTGKTMRGACRGHGGVDKSKSAAPAAAAPAAAAGAAAAPGGGAGKVWVNTESKVYHCQGDRFYGKTKKGEYMSEAQAKAQGFRASHDKACGAG